MSDLSPQMIAERSAAALWAEDAASRSLGLDLISVGPGRAEMALNVQPVHANGHGICHGGYVFLLADSAFAFACNSYNQRAVAQSNTISYLAPGRVGTRLVAEAREVERRGRTGIYDVAVRGAEGEVIALFRGQCRTIAGTLFEP
ncbi:MAG: hydroxyphenylacetyl-CoA thioesterase PaaI [Pseudomonadota bacterium]